MIDVLPAGFTRLMAQASLSTGIAEPKLACWYKKWGSLNGHGTAARP
jgi:hypothetical protein